MSNRSRAFTLVELLVVISIIALLMAILAPSLTRVRKQAWAVVCMANLKQWGLVWEMFTADNDGRFMSGYETTGGDNYGQEDSVWDGDHSWPMILLPYYRQKDLLCCPTANKAPPGYSGERIYNRDLFSTWGLWVDYPDDYLYGSYGINSWSYDRHEKDGLPYWRHIRQKQARRIPLLLDCFWCEGYPHHTDSPPPLRTGWLGETASYMQRFCVDRHMGHTNGLFYDLSVRQLSLKELWRIKWNPQFDLTAPLPVWPDWMDRFEEP